MNAQVVPRGDLDIGRGHDVRGQKFGQLTALRIIEKGDKGNRWLLSCDCGRFAVEPVEATRRLVELSVLSRGSQIVQGEITAMEDQARTMGWPT